MTEGEPATDTQRDAADNLASDPRDGGRCPIVGIGASAGGVAAPTGGVVQDSADPPPGMRGVTIDITQLKQSEEALREHQARLQFELSTMQHLHDLVARLLECKNQEFALSEIIDSTVEATGGKMGCIQICDPATGDASLAAARSFPEQLTEMLRTRSMSDVHGAEALKSGQRVVWEKSTAQPGSDDWRLAESAGYSWVQLSPLMSRKGELIGVLSVFFDETCPRTERDMWVLDLYCRQAADSLDRIEPEDAVRQSEAQFREVFDVSVAAAVEVDPATGEISRLNQTFSEMVDRPPAECIGHSFFEFVHPGDRDVELGGQRGIPFNQAGAYQGEMRILRKDGSTFWGLVLANVVRSSPLRATILVLDVTSRREAESSLMEQNRHKDEFIAMLGHELRNPLAAIRNATDLLKAIPFEDGKARRARRALDRQSAHMARLIDGLLEISRIARGKVNIDLDTIDLRDVLQTLLEDRESEIEGKGLDLVRDLPAHPVWILADSSRMAQIFDNLIGNAIKFTPAPGCIRLSLTVVEDQAVISVRDTGCGIRTEVLPHVFDAFHQDAQDVSRSSGGLGLGLPLAKGLLDLHRGTIEAYSAGPGKGARFAVRLPLSAPPRPTTRPPPAEGPNRLSVLIIDDNPDAAEMLDLLLRIRGHAVRSVDRAEAAFEILRGEPFDVVLCDIGLPGMTGYDFCRKVRANPAHDGLYLVAVTGYGQPRDRAAAKDAGFDQHLTKPVEMKSLDQVLSRIRWKPGSRA